MPRPPRASQIAKRFVELARQQPSAAAVLKRNRGESVTFTALLARASELASAIVDATGRGRPALVAGRDDESFITGMLAVLLAGGVACPVPPEVGWEGCRWVADALGERPGLFVNDAQLDLPRTAVPMAHRDHGDVTVVLPTSGTTRAPVGIPHPDLSLISHLPPVEDCRSPTRWASTFPRESVSWLSTFSWSVLCGGAMCEIDRLTPQGICEVVEGSHVEVFTTGVPILSLIVRSGYTSRHDISSLSLVGVGGAQVSWRLLEQTRQAFGCPVVVSYGTTELGGPVAATSAAEDFGSSPPAVARGTPAGCPFDGISARVVDDDFRPLPRGRIGQLMIQRSMAGASCGGATMPDTWRATGDRACIGPKGEIQILGRVDDLIQRAGTDIEIPVIEDTLAECEGVAKAAAIGVPDDTLGDALWVFVERRRGGNLTGASLRRHLRTHFPNLAVDTVVITDAVPATRTGEPRKFVLRKWAAGRLSEGDGRHQGDFVGVRVAQA